MVTLTLSFKELLDFLRINIKKFPKVLESLKCNKNRFSLRLPRKDASDIPLDILLKFSTNTFRLTLDAGEIKELGKFKFTTGQLFDFFEEGLGKSSAFWKSLKYNDDENAFHFTIKPKKESPDKAPPFKKPIELLAKLVPHDDDGFELRVKAVS